MDATPTIDLRSYDGTARKHEHRYHQFVLPLTGTLDVDMRAGARRVERGAGILIAAGEEHAFRGVGLNRFVVVDVPVSARGHLFDRARREPGLKLPTALEHHLALVAERGADRPPSPGFCYHWTALLLEALGAEPGVPDTGTEPRFSAAIRFIHAHRDQAITAADVARAVELSTAGLYALFRRHAHCGPREWIGRERLARAASLLTESDRTVAEIAYDCGFSEHSALTRAFRRCYGESPTDYRRRVAAVRTGTT